MMTVYIASSFRNLHGVHLLQRGMEDLGCRVLDWTRYAPPLPEHLTPEERRAALDADERGEIFEFCAQACGMADLVIYLGQAGQDAACEVGMAHVAGVPVYGLAGPLERPGTILARAVSRWFDDVHSLLLAVDLLVREQRDPATLDAEA